MANKELVTLYVVKRVLRYSGHEESYFVVVKDVHSFAHHIEYCPEFYPDTDSLGRSAAIAAFQASQNGAFIRFFFPQDVFFVEKCPKELVFSVYSGLSACERESFLQRFGEYFFNKDKREATP